MTHSKNLRLGSPAALALRVQGFLLSKALLLRLICSIAMT